MERNELENTRIDIVLIRPTLDYKDKAIAYRQEHFEAGEYIIHGSELLDKTDSYEEWLQSVTDNTCIHTVNPNWVVTDTFFAIDSQTKDVVGIIDLRHTLNEYLTDFGNCGYSVRPSLRRQGIATKMLGKLIIIGKEAGLSTIQLSVERDNIPSISTIKKNGGVYERSFEYLDKLADIYIISI